MKELYGYIRVSTPKQGEQGVSLQEQRDAIQRYATKNNVEIVRWFEERETAAKRGRPIWSEMLRLLKQGKAPGVVIHKIDRSARNLRDWADLGDLIDRGSEIRFVNETLDLGSRGGRLSADIQAVVAADFIRNLKEETRKGIDGRLKQGLLPLPAPLGYLDAGPGKAKMIDPQAGPFIRDAFEFYASGTYTLTSLREELTRRGLTARRGGRLSLNSLSTILNNPFYMGLIRMKRARETYAGVHPPLIPKRLFDRVQAVLRGRANTRVQKHAFLFRRLLKCRACGYSLIGETRKGNRYYRCHTRTCERVAVREDQVVSAVAARLVALQLTPREKAFVRAKLEELRANWLEEARRVKGQLRLDLAKTQERLSALTDALLDGLIEKEIFSERKEAHLLKRREIEDRLAEEDAHPHAAWERLAENLGLAETPEILYETATDDGKRNLLLELTSDRIVDGKELAITMAPGFDLIVEREKISSGVPLPRIARTWDALLPKLIEVWSGGEANPHSTTPPRATKEEDRAA